MWIPESEGELVRAIEAGDLVETATFDAKADLPKKGKSKDLAIDVAAMANDGGTLLYGVGEDDHGRPTILRPIELSGARERVDQIVRSCISEPPIIETRIIPKESEPGSGYLVVAVPPSPRAPHMVVVGKDYRYYGRSDTGNVPLTEGEVARHYERRRRWDIDKEALLDEEIDMAPLEPHDDFAYLHLVAKPLVGDEFLLDRAQGTQHIQQCLNGLFSAALSDEVFQSRHLYPDLSKANVFRRRADGWVTSQGLEEEWEEFKDLRMVLQFKIGLDGSGHLFCGSAAQRSDNTFLLYEDLVAGLTARFLVVLGGLYAAGRYLGPVDVGLAVTGLEGSVSAAMYDHYYSRVTARPFDRDQYRRLGRFLASALKDDPRGCARELVLPLARATTLERYDPFAN